MPGTIQSNFGTEQKKEFLRNAPEVSLFITCLGLINELRALDVAFRSGELTSRTFSKQVHALLAYLNETVEATERFDIVWPVKAYGQFSSPFWRWFNWWDDYLKGLSVMQRGDLARQARERLQTVNDYRPENHWVTHRPTPAFALLPS